MQNPTEGRRLLAALIPVLQGHGCYCFPFSHLRDFYAAAGFVAMEPQTQPDFIAEAFHRYCSQGRDIILMVRTDTGRSPAGGSAAGAVSEIES